MLNAECVKLRIHTILKSLTVLVHTVNHFIFVCSLFHDFVIKNLFAEI